jgi:hypothetical protein
MPSPRVVCWPVFLTAPHRGTRNAHGTILPPSRIRALSCSVAAFPEWRSPAQKQFSRVNARKTYGGNAV